MQININFKLIRELSGIKQVDIAPFFKIKLSRWKSYENTDIRPKANIITAVAKFAGIEPEDLDKKLTHADIHFEDRKDRKDIESNTGVANFDDPKPLLYDGLLTINDLLSEKEARRRESQERAEIAEKEKDRLLGIIETNLSQLLDGQQKGRAQLKTVLELTVSEIATIRKQNPEAFLKKVNKVVDENLNHIRGKGSLSGKQRKKISLKKV